jgi:putative membrane protein
MKTIVTLAVALGMAAPALAQKEIQTESPKLSVKDRQFIELAASQGLAEIKMARLALDKAESLEVRQFAQQMIEDHSRANDQLKSIAQRYRMPVPTSLDTQDQATYEKLAMMNGKDFDREYAKIQKKGHDRVISEYEKASNDLDNPTLREFAQTMLPTMKQHDEHAKTLKTDTKREK